MTCREVYLASLALVCESQAENPDYEERAPYLLAAVSTQLAPMDRAVREAAGEDIPAYPNTVYLGLDEEFPLTQRLLPAALYYVGAMLVIDENEEMYEDLFALFSDAMAKLRATLPATPEPIRDVYRELI